MLSVITRLFPLWALLLSVLAYYTPATFTGIGPWVATLLMLIMFGMGVHLKSTISNACCRARLRLLRVSSCITGDAARGVVAGDGL